MLATFYVDLMYFSLVDQVEIVGSPLLHIMIMRTYHNSQLGGDIYHALVCISSTNCDKNH